MLDFDYLRERHVKAFIIFMFSCGFIYQNWGYTLGAIKHVFLMIIARNLKVLEDKHVKEISETIIDFGETGALLTVYIFMVFVIFQVINWINYDGVFREYDIKILHRENRKLVKQVRDSQKTLAASLTLIEQFETINAQLTKHLEQVVELSFSIDKLHQKSKRITDKAKTIDKEQAPDLFDISKPQKKRPPRRRVSNRPKF